MKSEPAFPCKEKRNTSSDPLATPREFNYTGMTLRDYFAGQALVGILANPGREDSENWSWQTGTLTGDAYMYADAMLAEREKSR